MNKFRPIHITTTVLVGTYLVTTGFGAALFTSQIGREQLAAHLYPQPVPIEWMTTLGSPLYWYLLLSMILIAPIAAFAAERATARFASSVKFPEMPTWIPLTIAAGMSGYCIYKLAMAGGLSAREAWDNSVCYDAKILRRVQLFGQLGTRFYCFVYSGLPMIGCYLLAQGIKKKDALAYAGCAGISALVIWFDVAIMMKAPAVIYIGTLGLTLALCGFGFLRSVAVTVPVAVGIYAALSVMQFCSEQAAWGRAAPSAAAEVLSPMSTETMPSGNSDIIAAPPILQKRRAAPKPADENSTVNKAWHMARAAVFRMAAGFPYYVQTFSEPDQRCGIEQPPYSWLEKQPCFGPIKVFSKMYPDLTYTTGFQPAPASVSAYGEAGLWYVLAATILCGLIIGAISAFSTGDHPQSIVLIVACCIYAYYVSQTSLTGSLIDSYGLIWLLFPIVLMTIIQTAWAQKERFNGQRFCR
jgi:hypothetical protein